MAKNVIKEIIICLLLCLAIILILGVVLYEYVPMAKTLPNDVEYKIPAEIKEQLSEIEEVEDEKIIMTYDVNSTDLSNYKRAQKYKPGKPDPFSTYKVADEPVQQNPGDPGSKPINPDEGYLHKPTQGK